MRGPSLRFGIAPPGPTLPSAPRASRDAVVGVSQRTKRSVAAGCHLSIACVEARGVVLRAESCSSTDAARRCGGHDQPVLTRLTNRSRATRAVARRAGVSSSATPAACRLFPHAMFLAVGGTEPHPSPRLQRTPENALTNLLRNPPYARARARAKGYGCQGFQGFPEFSISTANPKR